MQTSPLRTIVQTQRAREENTRLTDNRRFAIEAELLSGTRLLSDRLAMLDLLPKGAVFGEVGVAQGNFSREILRRCEPQRLHLIDPWDSDGDTRYSISSFENIRRDMSNRIESGQVVLHRGYSQDVLAEFSEDYFDVVYIDAAHDYASVKAELELCRTIVKSGGLIAGHDYIRWAGPTARYGVVEAVNEFANATRSPLVFLTNQVDKHDSFALRFNK
jgi:hypothetical protein